MFKRIAPILSVLIALILDTAVIPHLYSGIFAIPLSLPVVIGIGILLGRARGMLYGLISGMLIDISAGTLGMKTFAYIAIGFLIGFLLDQQEIFPRKLTRRERRHQIVMRFVWVFAFDALYEIAMLLIQYMSNAVFEWKYVGWLLLRALLTAALYSLLHPLFRRIFIGKYAASAAIRKNREVKNY